MWALAHSCVQTARAPTLTGWYHNPDKVIGRVCSTCYTFYTGHGYPRRAVEALGRPRTPVAGVGGVAGAAHAAADDLVGVGVPVPMGVGALAICARLCACAHRCGHSQARHNKICASRAHRTL